MAKIKRIFIAGAPGAMWSGADRLIRTGFGARVDNSDITDNRNWKGHLGAFWNPSSDTGNNGKWVLDFAKYDRPEIEKMLDTAFEKPIPEGMDYIVRTHKAHNWLYHMDQIEELFPESDIITTIQTEPYKCLAWWQYCGGHDHHHDPYDHYERDLEQVWNGIVEQTNLGIAWADKHNLERELPNVSFFKKHYGEPSKLLYRMDEELLMNPDKLDHWGCRTGMARGYTNTNFITIKYGNPRQF